MAWFRRAVGRVNGCAVTRGAAEVATRLADMAGEYPMIIRGKVAAAQSAMPQSVRCAYVFPDSQIGMDAALLDALLAHEIEREFTRMTPKLRQDPTRFQFCCGAHLAEKG